MSSKTVDLQYRFGCTSDSDMLFGMFTGQSNTAAEFVATDRRQNATAEHGRKGRRKQHCFVGVVLIGFPPITGRGLVLFINVSSGHLKWYSLSAATYWMVGEC